MSSNEALAIVQPDGRVRGLIRPDYPDGWSPPDGCTLVPVSQLPPGWQQAPLPPESVPDEIESRLLRRWLILHGHSIASIDAAIGAISDPVERELTRNEWEYATSYTRRHPMFPAFVRATGLSEEQIDQAFREAAGMA